jgi:uncharacterized membrane protein YfcA
MQQAITFAVLVGFINVALNSVVREAARPRTALIDWLGSDHAPTVILIVAVLIGFASLFAMFSFYRLEGNLARGLILMGTVSIVAGSILTMILSRTLVDWVEILLLIALSILLAFRWMKTVPWFADWISRYM